MSKDAKPDTWMPLVIGDYLKDTARLTTEQHGAYLLLIMDYWVNGAPPDDDQELAAITGLDAKSWRRNRDKLARYFIVEEGRWKHKRVERELEEWAARKAKYAERAAAGGRAKAAKSTASSTPKALLKSCSPSASREVEAPTGASTLSEKNDFIGPKEVRDAFRAKLGEDWCRTYLDRCTWQDVPERALIPATSYAGSKLIRDARQILSQLSLSVLEKAVA